MAGTLYYLHGRTMMGAGVETSNGFEFEAPVRLFDGDFRTYERPPSYDCPRRWQRRDDEVRERAVDLGAPELARDAQLPGRWPLTGPQAHSVLRPNVAGHPAGRRPGSAATSY